MKRAGSAAEKKTAGRPAGRRPAFAASDRRGDLVRAAYGIIATEGFEGLRTRGIVAAAGVNIATLHYYFPTKEALVGAVAQHLVAQFVEVHAPAARPAASPALTRLHQEFADARFYQAERPHVLTVVQEFLLRARRDPVIAGILDPLMRNWRGEIGEIVEAGIAEGVFRAELDPRVAAASIVATLTGAASHGLDGEVLEGILAGIEGWLRKDSRN